MFTLQKIAALAGSRQLYLRGVSLYNSGAVETLDDRPDAGGREQLNARVRDDALHAAFTVHVTLSPAGQAEQTHCTCGEMSVCRHIVAALTHKYYRDMVRATPAAPPPAVPSPARRMLDGYLHEAQVALRAALPQGDGGDAGAVCLYPALHLGNPAALTLTVGRTGAHAYTVKDIARFCTRVARGEEAAYGAGLTLVHHPDAFAPDSRPLLSLVTGADPAARRGRALSLTPAQLDRLFSLYEGQSLPVDGQETSLRNGDPPFSLTVEDAEDGARISAPLLRFSSGEERLYLLWEGALWGVSPGFAAALRGLLTALWDNGGALSLTERELREFGGSVLPLLEPYATFTGDSARLFAYRPLPLSAAVYIDQSAPLSLTARLEFRYGERVCVGAPGDEPPEDDGISHDRLGEWRAALAVSRAFPRFADGLYRRDCTDESLYDFLSAELPALSQSLTVYMSDAFRQTRVVAPPHVGVGVRLSGGLLKLDFDLGDLPIEELEGLLNDLRQRKRYHRLRSGAFLPLEDEAITGLARLSEGLVLSPRQLQRGHAAVPVYRAPFVEGVLADCRALGTTRGETYRALRDRLAAAEEADYTPPDTLNGTLRGYQCAGFRWLRTMESCGFGGILADDMGLGKTVQMIALLLDAQKRGIALPSLVVCPASLVLGWESELRRFAPSLAVRTVIGTAEARAALLREIAPGEVVLTSYDLLRRDMSHYESLSFHYHILDEAQYIKNHATQNARAVKKVRSIQRFALTGTPVENRLSELWSLFDFLMPGFLFSYSRFRDRFERPAVREGDPAALDALSRLCRPFILRRLKRDVLRELPPKTETVRLIPLEERQRRVYLAAALRARETLARDPAGQTRLQTLTMLTRLRQICCDPALCFENYTGGSAKREFAVELVREAVETGHRVLLFSQFTSMLAILEHRLREEGIAFYTLQGSTPKERRAAMVADFNRGDGAPVFLISLKAGGTGLNLPAADVVIHYDPWWNLSAQNQATDRAHRIGQQRPVQVYKLIAQDTVEEKILQLQLHKQQLADAVVRPDALPLSSLSDEELRQLLEE